MKNIFAFSLLLVFVMASCKKEFPNKQIETLYNSVMEIHDEVMPEMSTMNKLKKKVRKLEIDQKIKDNYITELDDADEAMMNWMHEFKYNKDLNAAQQKAYLETEKTKIQKVSDQMYDIINRSQKLVSK